MCLPLLIVPPGGIKAVVLPMFASHLFAPYETAWAWSAKLAAANALSAFEVAAFLGISKTTRYPLLPDGVPHAARKLGRTLDFPRNQIEHAFFEGALKSMRPLVCEQLRLCPACARLGYHFVIHQLRAFTCCPLHDLHLREGCLRCGELLTYDIGKSELHGPINCSACGAPQLPVSRSGFPITSAISAQTLAKIARWLAFIQQRVTHPVLFEDVGVIDAGKMNRAFRRERIPVIRPSKSSGNQILPSLRSRWLIDAQYKCLESCYWEHANRRWLQCNEQSRRWYRSLLKGCSIEPAPSPRILTFLYWRMTWQGCTNPYLLRRGHGLALYGIAEWEAEQPAHDDIDDELFEFDSALTASWTEWMECIDLLGAEGLDRHTWRLRVHPCAFIPFQGSK